MNFTWGILAHVDAGKTTLSESILFNAKAIASLGRVDHGDAFLDTDSQEKDRGITIFSKPAVFSYGENEMTLLDTPGHGFPSFSLSLWILCKRGSISWRTYLPR